MKIFFILGIFFSLSLNLAQARERSESFIIRSFDHYIQVLAPNKIHNDQDVVIENKTLIRIVGKLQTSDGKQVQHVAVEPGKHKVLSMKTSGQEHLVFIHLSPAFQEVELRVGKETYEIPSKR